VASPDEINEFGRLSVLVAEKKASDADQKRWRELRTKLAGAIPKPPMPGGPQRQHARSASRKLRISLAPVKQMQVTFTDEVGGGGVRLTLPQHLDNGTVLLLRLDLAGANDPEPLDVRGKVVWSRREGNHFAIGVEFVGLRSDERERIEAYLLAPATSEGPPKPP
jgi:hypothetical protein